MPVAAIPRYLGKQDLSSASPGMRFGMYLPIWTERADQERQIRKMASAKSREGRELQEILDRQGVEAAMAHARGARGRFPELWQKNDHAANHAWGEVAKLGKDDRDRMAALSARQLALAAAPVGAVSTFDGRSIAPFTTGLGNEHPLENGFAFLWPYGLPYLPGSGVKGVLRQAARELAPSLADEGIAKWGMPSDWSEAVIVALFGSDEPDHAQRGALTFWDVIPQINGNKLMVEVMTGHQGHYYMQGQTPHDSGQPVPVNFLTVPPDSGFTFHVVCDQPFLRRIAPELAENARWKTLLQQAFEHAFDWLGFGAKTAVGYGAMSADANAAERREHQAEQQRKEAERRAREEAQRRDREAALAQMDPLEREVAEMPDIPTAIRALEEGRWGDDQAKAAGFIRQRMEREGVWVERSTKKNPSKDKPYQRTLKVKEYLDA